MLTWHDLRTDQRPSVVDPRRRIRLALVGFALAMLVVFGRVVQLEVSQGAVFRAVAIEPVRRTIELPAARGRILARDGTVLAEDRPSSDVAMHYRWLEEPPNRGWLRQTARKRLSRPAQRDPQQVAAEEARVLEERTELHRRLATLCRRSPEVWTARRRAVQARVERIAAETNRRKAEGGRGKAEGEDSDASALAWLGRLIWDAMQLQADDGPPQPIVVAEEVGFHVLAEGVPSEVTEEIEAHGERYPGVRLQRQLRRHYPQDTMAAHVLGHLGRGPEAGIFIGRSGVERQHEDQLQGHPGKSLQAADRSGRQVSIEQERPPQPGRDLTLSIDPALQRTAEELLDAALRRREIQLDDRQPAGGAVVVMDVETGEVLAAASAPRFDPAAFLAADTTAATALLGDPASPLLDRTIQMALPPGSTFKTLTAVALLEAGRVDPCEEFDCRGYLKQPGRQRCAIYVQRGVGHGPVTLTDALAQSCNVYFFDHAGSLAADDLVDWGRRFGFATRTGIDLPSESAGAMPTPMEFEHAEGRPWRVDDTRATAVGQGPLTATPMQVVRMMAAVANGGRLVRPRIVRQPRATSEEPSARPIEGLRATTLAAIREGLERTVADPKGTAHATVYMESIAVAGKTGTATLGEGVPEHAWFAGYVPADRPRLAMVVVLQRSGNASTAACPIVKPLVLQMERSGLLAK